MIHRGIPRKQKHNGWMTHRGIPRKQKPNVWMIHRGIPRKQKHNGWMTHRGIPREQKHNSKKVLASQCCPSLLPKAISFQYGEQINIISANICLSTK